MSKDMIFGIDLGTTNSAIAVFTGVTSEILRVEGNNTFPSVVTFKPDGNHITGKEAYKNKGNSDTVFSAKTDMGTDKVYNLTLEDGSTLDVTPVDVASEVLKGITSKCSKAYGIPKRVVITVPAYFNASQREDTLKAAKLAGLEVVKLINEPVAGALSYGLDNMKENEYKEILVLDVGGGTTDVTKILISNYKDVKPPLDEVIPVGLNFNILATGGNNHLGGDKYDRYVFDDAIDSNLKKLGVEYSTGFYKDYTKRKAISTIENWKSYASVEGIRLQFPYEVNGKTESFTLSNYDLDKSFDKFWSEIKVCIDECLSIKDPDGNVIGVNKLPQTVVLVGGSTKNPRIINVLNKMYDGNDIIIPSPDFADESVALGAAIQGAIINKELGNVFIKDVNPLPIGIESAYTSNGVVVRGNMEYIIPKDCAIPTSKTFTYTTVKDNQKTLAIKLYQGVSRQVKFNNHIGTVIVNNLPDGLAGEVNIIVTVEIDYNGVLSVKAYNGSDIIESTFKSVLLPTNKEISNKDKNIIKGIKNAITFIKCTGKYSEYLTSLENWDIGDNPPSFLKEYAKEIRGFINSEMYKQIDEHYNKMFENTSEFEEIT
jgi:molecular chaperone DnaK